MKDREQGGRPEDQSRRDLFTNKIPRVLGGLGLSAIGLEACAETPIQAEQPVTIPIPDYEPPFQQERPVIKLEGFDLQYGLSAEELVQRLPEDLGSIIALLRKRVEDSDCNPNLQMLPWYQQLGRAPFLDPPTLLKFLETFKGDIEGKYVRLETVNKPDGGFNWQNSYALDEGTDGPRIGASIITINSATLPEGYPSLTNPSQKNVLSNLNNAVCAAYEYAGRYNALTTIDQLVKSEYFKQNPPKRPEDVFRAINEHDARKFKAGHRNSASQNFVQLAFHRSLAALAGDPTGKVVGMERNENWPPYKLYQAAMHGDTNAMYLLQQHLTVGATY